MKKYFFLVPVFLCFIGLVSAAERTDKGRFEIGLLGGGIVYEGNSIFDEDELYGAWIGYHLTNRWAFEAAYLNGDTEIRGTDLETDMSIPIGELQYCFTRSNFQPFVSFGAGGMICEPDSETRLYERDDFMAGYGLGLKLFLSDRICVRLHARHFINTEIGEAKNYGIFTCGLSWLFGCAKEVKEVVKEEAPVVADSDNDGVNDEDDKCPNTPPNVEVDFVGCPLDSDSDGVPDYRDACPDTPEGVKVDAKGCQVPEFLAQPEKAWVLSNVEFESGKDTIKSSSIPALDEAVQILKDNPSVIIEIQGHTDDVGSMASNQKLSEARAAAVYKYLVKKGIADSRVAVKGYGETQPIADNTTSEGRAKNRRIQFKVLSK